ncbi:hypothetical protein GCM10010415_64450 [Streptomyces atrovirens]|uniref:hypothetical protein n=1 Tax=Streptomyces atrovirens TaxID=285556 RepID=UPI0031E04743
MFDGLHDIDWSSMGHAYGTAEELPVLLTALCSPDADERAKALDRYYGAVHHQGDVYGATTASLPFLLELAGDDTTPDRAEVVRLLVSIAGTSVERCGDEYVGDVDYAGAAAALRARAEAFDEQLQGPSGHCWPGSPERDGVPRIRWPGGPVEGTVMASNAVCSWTGVRQYRVPPSRSRGSWTVFVRSLSAL